MPDVPAHDVLGVAPEMIARGDDPPASAGCLPRALSVAQDHAGGTVAEQRCRHEHGHARIVDPKAEAAKIDGEEQHMRARHRLRVARRSREPGNAAAATEPKHRQPLDRCRQIEPVHQLGVEARYGEAGDGVYDDGADVIELDASFTDGASRYLLEQIEGLVHEDFGPLFPTM